LSCRIIKDFEIFWPRGLGHCGGYSRDRFTAWKTDRAIDGAVTVEHIVELVEAQAEELKAAEEAEKLAVE
jgi:hypothetical protein